MDTPLGLPGQQQAVCTRVSYFALSADTPAKKADVHYYATSVDRQNADEDRLAKLIRGHWTVENGLHHVKDRT